MRRLSPTGRSRRGFSLVEAVLASVIVGIMFVAGMTAAGVAAKDRRAQAEIRTGASLARMLMTEVCAQRYADPSANTIAHWPGWTSTSRAAWTHMDDYYDFSETSPTDRTGTPIPGMTGWKWQASVAYQTPSSLTSAGTPTGRTSLLTGVVSTVTSVLGSATAPGTDPGMKLVTVTVTAPSGRVTSLTGFRCSAGSVDRMSTGTGFSTYGTVTIKAGSDPRTVVTGVELLNTP